MQVDGEAKPLRTFKAVVQLEITINDASCDAARKNILSRLHETATFHPTKLDITELSETIGGSI